MSIRSAIARRLRHGSRQLLIACSLGGLALNCYGPRGHAPVPLGTAAGRQVPSAQAAVAAAPDKLAHIAKSRSWQLSPDSPFTLVAESLREAEVSLLDRTTIVSAAPCGSKGEASESSSAVRAVLGDHFGTALPDAPGLVGRVLRGGTWFGHWPSDVWLRYGFPRAEPGPQSQFFHWDGGRWQTIPASPEKSLEPDQIFDWYDGAKLVAQTQYWHYTVSYAVEPFLIWGQTTHPAPDFSQIPFPRDIHHELQLTNIRYAVLPTHEVFVAHRLSPHDFGHTQITIAFATRAGKIVVDPVIDSAGAGNAQLTTGRLGQRDVVVAWGDLELNGRHSSWFRSYDGESGVTLPAPGPPFDKDGLLEVWFAGGQLWATRGNPPVVWRFDGSRWLRFAQLRAGTQLAPVVEDGSLWGVYGQEVLRYDAAGTEHRVPFLSDEQMPPYVARLVAAAPDDIWLIANGEHDESLLFRTKKMTSILACE